MLNAERILGILRAFSIGGFEWRDYPKSDWDARPNAGAELWLKFHSDVDLMGMTDCIRTLQASGARFVSAGVWEAGDADDLVSGVEITIGY